MGIGKPNALALGRNPRGRVVALCDLSQERMDEFAAQLAEPVQTFTDYKAMCRHRQIDAVFVGTPNQWHVPVALEAVRRDKHVLVTKPLADSERAAARLVRAAEAAGVVNMMSLSTRFSRPASGWPSAPGRVFLASCITAGPRSVRRNGIPAWNLGFIQAGGGAFRDMGVHVLDAAWSIMGQPRPVSVTGVAGAPFGPRDWATRDRRRPKYGANSPLTTTRRFCPFDNGTGLQVESFWASHQPGQVQIELFGTEAGAQMNPLTVYRCENGVDMDTVVQLRARGGEQSWDNIAAHFIDAILDGNPCQAPLRHGLVVQQMMEGLLRSAQSGKEVRLRPRIKDWQPGCFVGLDANFGGGPMPLALL